MKGAEATRRNEMPESQRRKIKTINGDARESEQARVEAERMTISRRRRALQPGAGVGRVGGCPRRMGCNGPRDLPCTRIWCFLRLLHTSCGGRKEHRAAASGPSVQCYQDQPVKCMPSRRPGSPPARCRDTVQEAIHSPKGSVPVSRPSSVQVSSILNDHRAVSERHASSVCCPPSSAPPTSSFVLGQAGVPSIPPVRGPGNTMCADTRLSWGETGPQSKRMNFFLFWRLVSPVLISVSLVVPEAGPRTNDTREREKCGAQRPGTKVQHERHETLYEVPAAFGPT